VADLILETSVTIPVKQILSIAPSVKSRITSEIKGRSLPTSVNAVVGVGETLLEMVEEKQGEIEVPELPLATSATAQMPVGINGHQLMAHYDGGSEINLITASLVKKCGLAVTSKDRTAGMIGAGGQRSRFVGELQCDG
jgi:hypothetical protein